MKVIVINNSVIKIQTMLVFALTLDNDTTETFDNKMCIQVPSNDTEMVKLNYIWLIVINQI